MTDTWNNVELSNMSRRKSYTLNHAYDSSKPAGIQGNQRPTGDQSSSLLPGKKHLLPAANGSDTELSSSTKVDSNTNTSTKPQIDREELESLLRRLYGITVAEVNELKSYDDRNYHITVDLNIKNPFLRGSKASYGYVLRVTNNLDSKKLHIIEAQNKLLLYLDQENIRCPKPVANVSGKLYSLETLQGGKEHVVRLFEFLPGKIFHEVTTTENLIFQSGEYLAKLSKLLKNFENSAYDEYKNSWQLQSVPKLKEYFFALKDFQRETLVKAVVAAFEKNVLTQIKSLREQIIHGDYNEQNIIVNLSNGDLQKPCYQISGIIDFGDTNHSPLLFEVAIGLTYMIIQARDLAVGGIFLAGFESLVPLLPSEKALLKYCVAARLVQSLVMGVYISSLQPDNDYITTTQTQGWKLLPALWNDHFSEIDEIWKNTAERYLTQSEK